MFLRPLKIKDSFRSAFHLEARRHRFHCHPRYKLALAQADLQFLVFEYVPIPASFWLFLMESFLQSLVQQTFLTIDWVFPHLVDQTCLYFWTYLNNGMESRISCGGIGFSALPFRSFYRSVRFKSIPFRSFYHSVCCRSIPFRSLFDRN